MAARNSMFPEILKLQTLMIPLAMPVDWFGTSQSRETQPARSTRSVREPQYHPPAPESAGHGCPTLCRHGVLTVPRMQQSSQSAGGRFPPACQCARPRPQRLRRQIQVGAGARAQPRGEERHGPAEERAAPVSRNKESAPERRLHLPPHSASVFWMLRRGAAGPGRSARGSPPPVGTAPGAAARAPGRPRHSE
ncbi:hypothetical protein NDU88_004319 [Pleurodeles waltl]|uniref:Uncharacterized protein n=1 Tax=Pleurodeles waltl TaxID=8319 RepID=A0AAV7VFY5_PLEWA|nr:hypothetical protein NDU88_004319 [Pleurodeles waltl]